MRYYCTYFDSRYLVRALALIRSLRAHETMPFRLFAVCHDELSRAIVDRLAIPEVVTVPMHALERADEALRAARTGRSVVEYYWTATPTVILRLLEQHPEIPLLTYLDSDLYFFGAPDPIFEEMGAASVLIHEHRFSPELRHLQAESGRFNVGLLAFRNDAAARRVLSRWREQCLEWCYARAEDGKMGDQGYLDAWPEQYPEVAILRNPGAGTAPWNQAQYRIARRGERVHVDDHPLVFYHFHALVLVTPEVVVPAKHLAYPMTPELLALCYVPYVSALREAIDTVRGLLPEFEAGLRTENVLAPGHTFLVEIARKEAVGAAELPGRFVDVGAGWCAYAGSQLRLHAPAEASVQAARQEPAAGAPGGMEAGGTEPVRVSAIVSTYRSEAFIRGCLEDLVQQTLFQKGELEIVVVDAASPEGEREIVAEFQERYPRIVYIRTSEREPIYTSWNRGIRMAKGRYLTNANTDDRHRVDALERLADFLDSRPDVALVYADTLITTVPNDTFAGTEAALRFNWPEYSYEELERRCFVGPHPVWRRALHDRHGYFDERYKSAGDYEFWLRAGRHETFARYPDVLGLYYHNAEGLQYSSGVSVREVEEIRERHGLTRRGIVPTSSPRFRVSPREREAWQQAGASGEAPTAGEADIDELARRFQARTADGDWSGAARIAEAATRAHPGDAYGWVMRAISCRVLGRHADAVEAVQRSLNLEETPFALWEVVEQARTTGHAAEAHDVARYLAGRFPAWSERVRGFVAGAEGGGGDGDVSGGVRPVQAPRVAAAV